MNASATHVQCASANSRQRPCTVVRVLVRSGPNTVRSVSSTRVRRADAFSNCTPAQAVSSTCDADGPQRDCAPAIAGDINSANPTTTPTLIKILALWWRKRKLLLRNEIFPVQPPRGYLASPTARDSTTSWARCLTRFACSNFNNEWTWRSVPSSITSVRTSCRTQSHAATWIRQSVISRVALGQKVRQWLRG